MHQQPNHAAIIRATATTTRLIQITSALNPITSAAASRARRRPGASQRVPPFALRVLAGFHFQLQLLAESAADEAAHGMRLLVGGLREFGDGGAIGPA